MSKAFFADAGDALRGFLPKELREFRSRTSSRNLKVWFGDETREHYEVQVISSRSRRSVLEIGYHAEHPDRAANEDAIDRVRAALRSLGKAAEAGAFLGRPSPWMRMSETWDGEGLFEPETAIEAAERLSAYIRALEPLRRKR
jgi:hypothetical protein